MCTPKAEVTGSNPVECTIFPMLNNVNPLNTQAIVMFNISFEMPFSSSSKMRVQKMNAQNNAPKRNYLVRGICYIAFAVFFIASERTVAGNWNKSQSSSPNIVVAPYEHRAGELLRIINQSDIAVGIKLEPYTDTSLRPGRLVEETTIVRTGSKALRLEIRPGDCGTPWPVQVGGWDDCGQGNERIGVTEERRRKGQWFYTASIFLDRDTFITQSSTQTHINLMQWLDQNSKFGPPFNLMWFWKNPSTYYLNLPNARIPPMSLVFDNRLSKFHERDRQGHDSWSPMKVIGTDSSDNNISNMWLDFTVYANWSANSDGWFLVALNGDIILDYRGSTIELGSEGLVFDLQLYRYGSRALASKNAGAVEGDTNNIMFVDNIGVFDEISKLANHRPDFKNMAWLLEAALKNEQLDSPKFQPPSKTSFENLHLRYEDCRASSLCNY